MKFKKNQKGYSLPQMLTATAVGAVLTGAAMTNYWSAVDNARITVEMESIERIGEAVNVVLASDDGGTTFLTDANRILFQKLIPRTGAELTYAIRSTWKGKDKVDGDHQYALSLDIYPRYNHKNIKVNLTSDITVSGVVYAYDPNHGLVAGTALPLGVKLPTGTAAPTEEYVVAVNKKTKETVIVTDYSDASKAKIVPGVTFSDAIHNVVTIPIANPNGLQKISAMAKALDAKIDSGDLGESGSVQYDDTCTSLKVDTCYIHIYLVDQGLSYNEAALNKDEDWHSQLFSSNMRDLLPKSTTTELGQLQSTVVLGKNGD